jgi:GNAT superfamily N-acetyltransferase
MSSSINYPSASSSSSSSSSSLTATTSSTLGITYKVICNPEIKDYTKGLIHVCTTCLREYPYLSTGTNPHYLRYLESYERSPSAIIVAALNKEGEVIGVANGMSMTDADPEYRNSYCRNGEKPSTIFYVGELAILPPYRGKGIAKELASRIFAAVTSAGLYSKIAMCQIEERTTHAELKPKDYLSNDGLWKKFGLQHRLELSHETQWQDIPDTERSTHKMVFWDMNLKMDNNQIDMEK